MAVACGCAGARAQTPAAETGTAAPAPVRMNIVVTDKAGNPIAGLKQDDFKLTDNRQPVTIRSFGEHQAADSSAAGLLIVLDNLNADFNAVTTERLQIEGYFRRNGGKLANPAAVFVLNESGLDELTPVSNDGNSLADTLHQKMAQMPMTRVTTGVYAAEERLNTSLQALSTLGRYLQNIGGRKVVVWFGPGWPVIDTSDADIGPVQQKYFYDTAAELTRMLLDEQITIHSVSPVSSNNSPGDSHMKELRWEDFLKPLTKEKNGLPGNVALQVFAIHSGGTVVLGSNDAAKEVARCAQDAASWYTVTFDAQKASGPNTWHDVDVKVDKPQTKVRTENGYYAQP
jgi:VWFA-related protein